VHISRRRFAAARCGERGPVSRVLERGDVFFFYRPRVGIAEVRGLDDVARLLVLLEPDGSPRFRLLVVGRKRLPDPAAHERAWALVAKVEDRPDVVRDELGRRRYVTKTRGEREEPEARPAGEGRYAIADHGGHTHLAYGLELPREPGPAQELFDITRQASYVTAVRNPEAPAPPGRGLPPGRRAEYPPELAERFGGRRFAPLDPPAFLDHVGAEIVLIGAAVDAEAELGIPLGAEDERLEDADLFADLGLRPGELPVEPLEHGELR
jgi:hypothetical protein